MPISRTNEPTVRSGRREFLSQTAAMALTGIVSAVGCGQNTRTTPAEHSDRRGDGGGDSRSAIVGTTTASSGSSTESSTHVQRITSQVIAVASKQLGVKPDSLKPSTRLREEIGADSLDVVELVMALEEEFGVSIPDVEAERVTTIGGAVEVVVKALVRKGKGRTT